VPSSNYPNGFAAGITIRGVPLLQTHPGQVFWVGNATANLLSGHKGGSNGNKGTFEAPFATLDHAIGRCTADRGDIIFIKPGHAETISTATTILADVAGVAIIGLGRGTKRPTFTLDTATTAKIPVSAANVLFSNIVFVNNFADIATVFLLTTAPGFTVDNCEFRDTSSILNALTVVTTTVSVDADGLSFTGNRVLSLGTTAATTAIKILGTINRLTICDNYFSRAAISNTAVVLAHAALVVSNLDMGRNRVFSPTTDTATGGLLITRTSTTNTGMIYDNYVKSLDVAGMLIVTTGSAYGFTNNHMSGTADTSGIVIPAADSDGS
jgi:hypothetical protein